MMMIATINELLPKLLPFSVPVRAKKSWQKRDIVNVTKTAVVRRFYQNSAPVKRCSWAVEGSLAFAKSQS